jgi:5-methylcytosine-specific restriction enzyme subunit McrC
MFAYGQKYLHGQGNMMLIYPRHQYFATPLPVFRFDEDLSLWCVPFDLESGELVKGEWQDSFRCFPVMILHQFMTNNKIATNYLWVREMREE